MDISSDSKLIITCSVNKNVKTWALDFGDRRGSIYAQGESTMQITFERNHHYLLGGGQGSADKVVYWDGDKVRDSRVMRCIC
jgi:U3 small nucleolar RNA-associated protein 12